MSVNVEVSPVLQNAGIDTVCILWVPRNDTHEHLLCVQCEATDKFLPQSAGNILTEMLTDAQTGTRHPIAEGGNDIVLEQTLTAFRGANDQWTHYTLMTVGGGRHAGFRAVGLGGKATARRRAAIISLVASAIYCTYLEDLHRQGPTELSEPEKKRRIRDAVRSVAQWQGAQVQELLADLVDSIDEEWARLHVEHTDAATSASSGAAAEQRQR